MNYLNTSNVKCLLHLNNSSMRKKAATENLFVLVIMATPVVKNVMCNSHHKDLGLARAYICF